VKAWRITERAYVGRAFTGRGAAEYGGRFNSVGTPIVYAGDTVALCLLEILVNHDEADLHEYVVYPVDIPDACIEDYPRSKLKKGWDANPAPDHARKIGDDFVRRAKSVAMRIPNACSQSDFTILLNPTHPDFRKVQIGRPRRVRTDEKVVRKAKGK
jgi:RES domain-containing protein